jgi:predicted dehydrogenase
MSGVSGPLRLAIFGCGRAAERLYVPALAHVPEARLVAAFDPVAARRELIAGATADCRAYASAEALLQNAHVDAVIVASPPETHLAAATLALCAGVPVLVEKPLATSVNEARQLAALQAAARLPLAVGLNRRWWPPAERLRAIIAERGCASTAAAGRATVEMCITSDVGAWSPVSGVRDPLDDLGTHQLDLLRYLFDREIVSVAARRTAPLEIRMTVRLEGGVSASCLAGQTDRSQEQISVTCGGTRYRIRTGSERVAPEGGGVRRALDLADGMRRRLTRGRSGMRRSFERQLRGFVECVRSGSAPRASVADGIAVLRAVEAARASALADGAEVTL